MTRVIQSADLEEWEAFASTGPNGFPEPARIVFRCRSDGSRPPLAVQIQGDKAEAERRVAQESDRELLRLLGEAREIR